MILQALYELYQRLPNIDRPGFAPMGVSWAVVLSEDGRLVALSPLRQKSERGNKTFPQSLSCPTVGKRTANDKPCFLADKTDYVLGCHTDGEGDPVEKKKLVRRFTLFRQLHLDAKSSIQHKLESAGFLKAKKG